jgi:hypothetical protein
MHLAPNLVECVFELMDVFDIRNPDDHEKVVLPALRRLIFGPSGTCPVSDDDVLKCLSLPALEALSLSIRDVSGDDLISFLKRSSPPLQELVLGEK